jgi:hypothetical protein
MKSKIAKPKQKVKQSQPEGPLFEKKHNCALFKRKDNKWKWVQGGNIASYPRRDESVIVAYSKTEFSYTNPIIDVISIEEDEPNAIEIVFQDDEAVWKLIFPAHSNNIDEIKKALKKKKEKPA